MRGLSFGNRRARHASLAMRHLSLLLFTATLLGQSHTSPLHFAVTEGPTNNSLPFGAGGAGMTPLRYLQIHDGVPAMTISGMAFRHNTSLLGVVHAPFTVTVDVWMSTSTVAATAAFAAFATNHGPNKVQVVTNRVVSIPGNDPSRIPNPFNIDVPFDPGVTFLFAGGGASLCWEMQLTARTNTDNVPFDAVANIGNANPPTLHSPSYTGCLATGRTLPMTLSPYFNPILAPTSWQNGNGSLATSAVQLAANGIVVFVHGTDRTTWNGLPLPFLIPGSTGAPSGPCTLLTDLGFTRPAIAAANGTATNILSFPLTPALHGATFYTQVVGLDQPANALGLTASNLITQQLCATYLAPGVQRVYLTGSLGPVGTISGLALITRFY